MAALTADVVAELNERSSQLVADRLVRDMGLAGRKAGDELGKGIEEGMRQEMARINSNMNQLGSGLQDGFSAHGRRAGDTFGKSFGSQLAQSLPGISGFASAMSGYEGAAGKMGALAGRALGLAFTTAAAGLIGAAGYTIFKGFERYEAIDAAKNRLENLNRTLEQTGRATIDVGAVMNTVNSVVEGTRFSLDQAFSISTRALSSPTGDLQRFMTAVADTAQFTGENLESVGEAFLKIANKGKVSMEELGNELRGIPMSWLAEHFQVSGAELTKMISDGKVGFEDLLQTVEANVSGFAKGSVDTISGQVEQVQTAVARLGANLLGALFGKPTEDGNDLVQVLKTVRERLDEVNAWVTAHQGDIKRVFEQGVDAAKDLATAVQDIMGFLDDIGIGVDDVVKAFVAWKVIQGVSSLTTALGGINSTLKNDLPASANTAAAGISAALNRIVLPAWLATLGLNKIDEATGTSYATGLGEIPLSGVWFYDRIFGDKPWLPNFGGGGAPTPDRGPDALGTDFFLGNKPTMPATPGNGMHWEDGKGWVLDGQLPPGVVPPAPAGSPILPPAGADGKGGGPRLPAAPVVPYADLPPVDPRLQMTASLFSSQTSVADAATRLAEKEARVNQLRGDNNATDQDILNAENDVAKARREKQEADMRFAEAQRNAFEQQTKQLRGTTGALDELGAALDQDLGISKGLAGIADNLVRFLGSLALAGPMAQMAAISNANPNQGSGLMGFLGSTGALGPMFMPQVSAMGPSAYGGGTSPAGFDAALLANVPAGQYTQERRGDLTQGLADCSSAVEDLVNIMDGRPTAGASMSTANAAEWLTQRGFLPGSMPGAFNVGFNEGHMQATLPGGTPFNWGSAESAARGGRGGSGAFDPSFTSHFYRPVGGVPATTPAYTAPAATAPATTAPAIPGAPSLYSPENTNPGLNNPPAPGPLPTSILGGRGESPILGLGPAPGTALTGQPYPAGPTGGGLGVSEGLMGAASLAASVFPGGGALAQMGMQLANRSIKYAGQMAGIGVQGFLSAITPAGDNPKASIGSSWFGKVIGGLAQAKPATPNAAGGKKQQPPGPMGGPGGQQGGAAPAAGNGGNTINFNQTNNHTTADVAAGSAIREMGAANFPNPGHQ